MGKQRVERTRAGGRWTEARFFSFLRGLLRGAFTRWPPKHDAKKMASRKKKGTRRFEYHCAACRKWFPNSEIEVDHIVPAGSLRGWDDLVPFTQRLYCEAKDLQVMCKPCHKKKTAEEREAKKNGRGN